MKKQIQLIAKQTLITIFAILALNSCTDNPKVATEKKIAELQSRVYGKNATGAFNTEKAQELTEVYSQYIEQFPEDKEKAPEYLFLQAELYKTLKQFDKAIAAYQLVQQKYPDYSKAPQALFLIGFIQENDLKQTDEAKKNYELFLSKYPQNDLAKDVQFSLQYLGKSADEIVKSFEQNTNNTKTDTTKK